MFDKTRPRIKTDRPTPARPWPGFKPMPPKPSAPPHRVCVARNALDGSWVLVPAALTQALLMYTHPADMAGELRRLMAERGLPGRLLEEWYTLVPMDFDEACRLSVAIMDRHRRDPPEPPLDVSAVGSRRTFFGRLKTLLDVPKFDTRGSDARTGGAS